MSRPNVIWKCQRETLRVQHFALFAINFGSDGLPRNDFAPRILKWVESRGGKVSLGLGLEFRKLDKHSHLIQTQAALLCLNNKHACQEAFHNNMNNNAVSWWVCLESGERLALWWSQA